MTMERSRAVGMVFIIQVEINTHVAYETRTQFVM